MNSDGVPLGPTMEDRLARLYEQAHSTVGDQSWEQGYTDAVEDALAVVKSARCATCRWWEKRVEDGLGNCLRYEAPDMGVLISAMDRFPRLVTRDTFGCVQHEERC